MDSVIIEVYDLLIKMDANKLEQPIFTIEYRSDYLLEISNDNGQLKVTNAINGYGFNCRENFADKEVTIYR